MTTLSKTAGILSIISSIRDIHATGLIYSKNERAKATSDSFVSTAIGNEKANYISKKDTDRKNFLMRNNFFIGLKEAWGSVKGYFKGAGRALLRYLPKFILAAAAIIPKKHKTVANVAAIGLAGLEAADYINNGTSTTERKDYIKM